METSVQRPESSAQMLERSASAIFEAIIGQNVDSIELAVAQMCHILMHMKPNSLFVTIPPVEQISKVLSQLYPLFTSPFYSRVVKKTVVSKMVCSYDESMEKTTFETIFRNMICAENWHNTTAKGTAFTCDFHVESLFCHSLMACVSALWYSINEGSSSFHDLLKVATVALLHDIGKPASRTTGKIMQGDKNLNVTKFAAHGLIGGVILQRSFSPLFGFSTDEWDDICRAVTVHMCGYHESDHTSPTVQPKWTRLALERPNVKKLLCPLSIGDNGGKVESSPALDFFQKVLDSRKVFSEFLSVCMDDGNVFKKLGTSGLVITIMGTSAAGKTTLAKSIIKLFEEQDIEAEYVSRDQEMLNIVCPIVECENNGSGETYAKCHQYVEVHPEIKKEIDEQMKTMIDNAIAFGNVCIIDTVMATYKKAFNTILPSSVLSCDVFQIYVDRNTVHTEADANRLGIDLEKQIRMSGECSIENPFAKIDSANLSSLGSVMEGWSAQRNPLNRSQATLTASVVWGPDACFGWTNVEHILRILSTGISKGTTTFVDTSSMDLVEYVNYLYSMYEVDETIDYQTILRLKVDALRRRFAVQHFAVTTPSQFRGTDVENRFFLVKYRDGINRLWRPTWARKCRSVCFYVKDDGTCVPIKYQLKRGAELFTDMLAQAKIASTQDISDASKLNCLADSQQRTCKILLAGENDGNIDATITEKVDGSLLTVTEYYGDQADIMISCVTAYGDDLAKTIMEMFFVHGKMVVVSTQGTIMIGNDMQDYFVTSVLESTGIDRAKLIELAPTHSPAQIFKMFGSKWVENVVALFSGITMCPDVPYNNMSLCFESVCKDRITAWGTLHTELAVSYDESMCLFLGASWTGNDYVVNVPHTLLPLLIAFDEPRFWRVRHASEVDSLMQNLQNVVYGTMTTSEFLKAHPPANLGYDVSRPLHPEGFVIYTVEGTVVGLPDVDYNKLKLAAYYIGHKFHDRNIRDLYNLSKTASHIFPLARTVGTFFGSVSESLLAFSKALHSALSDSSETNPLVLSLDAKAKTSYMKASPDVRAKMIINARSTGPSAFDTMAYGIILLHYPLLRTTTHSLESVYSGLKRLVMDLCPWLNYNGDSVPEHFVELMSNPIVSSGISNLFLYIMEQQTTVDLVADDSGPIVAGAGSGSTDDS